MTERKICTRCVMDNVGDPCITYDEHGQCNYCTEALRLLEQNNKNVDDSKLQALFEKIKADAVGQKYDCLVGVSGGLDSSYVIYLGHKYGLRMLGVHIDDGLDTDIAEANIDNLCSAAKVDLIRIKPDPEQYRDLCLSFFKASVPNLAIPQDNLILAALTDTAKQYKLKYLLHGSNLSMESILQSGNSYTAADSKHIRAIHKRFGKGKINKLRLISTFENSVLKRIRSDVIRLSPLNMIDYRLDTALSDLEAFCGYRYYDGKHHESVICRFMQCWYLPNKYNADKRKSHLSSLIVSGQLTREEALDRLEKKGYPTPEMMEYDFNRLAEFLGVSRDEFERIIALPPRSHDDYPKSFISNKLVPFILKHRRLFKI